MRLAGPLILVCSLVGCGGHRGGGGDGDLSSEAQACLDTAASVAEAAERCGGSYQDNYDAFVEGAANGDCTNIIQIRDSDALYEECLPSLEVLECDVLLAGDLDPSCREQLLREQ